MKTTVTHHFFALISIMQLSINSTSKVEAADVYNLLKVSINQSAKDDSKTNAKIEVITGYDLPEKPIRLKLSIKNISDKVIYAQSPLLTLVMSFSDSNGLIIKTPQSLPPAVIKSAVPITDPPAPIQFISAKLGDVESKVYALNYEIKPNAEISIIFECKKIVSEKLLEAVSHTQEKFVYASIGFPLINLQDKNQSEIFRSDNIKLDIPKQQ